MIAELNIKSRNLFKSFNQIVITRGNKNSGHNSLRIDIDSNFPELKLVRDEWNELKLKLDKLKSDLIASDSLHPSGIMYKKWIDKKSQQIIF